MEQLKKAAQLYGFVALIDQQLNALATIGAQLINTENIVYLNFSLEDLNQMPSFTFGQESGMDEGMPTMQSGMAFMVMGPHGPQFLQQPPQARDPRGNLVMHIHKFRLTSKMALMVLQLLSTMLTEQKEQYLKQLKEIFTDAKVGN